jgi:uncharacterized protein (DUF433 family)
MTELELLDRITVDPGVFGGKPIIRGMRMSVEHVLGILAALIPTLASMTKTVIDFDPRARDRRYH